jgi:hypothetical protein
VVILLVFISEDSIKDYSRLMLLSIQLKVES